MTEVTHFKLARYENLANELKFVNADTFTPNDGRKKIFVFPGNLTVDEKIAGNMCKMMEHMFFPHLNDVVNINNKQLDIQIPPEILQQRKYRDTSLRNSTDMYILVYKDINKALIAQEFFDNVMVKLISEKNASGDLVKIDAVTAAHNMRNFVGVTHCFGSYIIRALDSELSNTLQLLNYSPEEQKLISRQWVSFHHNNVDDKLAMYQPHSLHLQRMSQADTAYTWLDYSKGSFQRFFKSTPLKDNKFSIIRFSENELAFLLSSVTVKQKNEHQYGYWNNVDNLSRSGLHEYQAFKMLADEVLQSKYLLENVEQLWSKAILQGKGTKTFLRNVTGGNKYWQDYNKYKRLVEAAEYLAASSRDIR